MGFSVAELGMTLAEAICDNLASQIADGAALLEALAERELFNNG